MTRKMKDSGIEWIGEIPEEWKISKIKHISRCLDGRRIPIDASLRKDGKYPYWGAGSIQGYVDDYIFDEEIILLGEDGAPFFDKSREVAFLIDEKVWVNNHIHVLKGTSIENPFLVYFLNIVDYTDYINGSILKKLTKGNMKNISVASPDSTKQIKIIELLNRKTEQIENIKSTIIKEIQTLEEYKKSVITEAVTKGLDKNVEMKDSGIEWIGEIPKHWIKAKIKHACSIVGSGTTPKSNNLNFYSDDGNFWIQSGDLYKSSEIINTEKKVSNLALKTYSALKIYESPFLVMAMYGASVGNLSISKIDAATNQACCVMKTNNSANLFYLYYWLLFVKDDFLRKAEGGSQPNISQDKIKNQIIYFPTILEQNKIANYLNKKTKLIDDSIAIKQKQLETLEEYKKSLIYEYVTGKKEVKDGEES